jgi:hypothetical protein
MEKDMTYFGGKKVEDEGDFLLLNYKFHNYLVIIIILDEVIENGCSIF